MSDASLGVGSTPSSSSADAGNAASDPQATDVTDDSGASDASNDPSATDVTANTDGSSGGVTVSSGPDDSSDDPTADSGVDIEVDTPDLPPGADSATDQSATSSANSTQTDPSNTNITVRVNSPGNNGAVVQSNSSSATATAGTSSNGNDPTSISSGTPSAISTQTNPSNLNVSVRVNSPGNDGSVTQSNTSTATIGLPSGSDGTPNGNGQNSYGTGSNQATVDQQLQQCSGDSGPCPTTSGTGGPNDGSPLTANLDPANAQAIQQNPSNINVSIRVGSPGNNGDVNQQNAAVSNVGGVVTTTTDGNNVNIQINVPAGSGQPVVPTGNDPWNWNWNWNNGGGQPSDPGASPTDSSNWNWNWTNQPSSADPSNANTGQNGVFTWTWVWTHPDGTTTTYTYSQPCNCNWSWTWTWVSPAASPAPTTTTPGAPPALHPPTSPQVSQTNSSSAQATAVTSFDATQISSGSSDGGDQTTSSESQSMWSDQEAIALATSIQLRPNNTSIVTAGNLQGLKQSNVVGAKATATATDTETQVVEQSQVGTNDGAAHAITSNQLIETTQVAVASSTASQSDAANITMIYSTTPGQNATIGKITQTNSATVWTNASATSSTTQTASQAQVGGGADQTTTGLQIALVDQSAISSSNVGQTDVVNLADVSIPPSGIASVPINQSHKVSAGSNFTDRSTITQSLSQGSPGDGLEWDLSGTQVAVVSQDGSASSSAGQSHLLNVAHWQGVAHAVSVSSASVEAPTYISGGLNGVFGGLALPFFALTGAKYFELGTAAGAASAAGAAYGLAGLEGAGSGITKAPSATSRTASTGGGATVLQGSIRTALLSLLGALSSAPGLLSGVLFAALLALFTLAVPGVRRVQTPTSALGRPMALRALERPG
ncbi:MAG TPA: hypothetical protein VEH52_13970 [Gaiellaceae bacterium]|nr:hypothetical protein [Gaiellaceae bacterium]